MRILGIETSCDETAVAIVRDGRWVEASVISSQQDAFRGLGGVIPEVAAREQLKLILPALHACFSQAEKTWDDIDAIACTVSPGLTGSLLVGTTTARTLASIHGKPLFCVDHIHGHMASTWLFGKHTSETFEPVFPLLCLTASGGHTELWLRQSHTSQTLLGKTRDDAAGEAFDKGASLLGLPYPGGPAISRLAKTGDATAFSFPLPFAGESTLDFSFSGLKTSLRYLLAKLPADALPLENLAASFERAICRHLCDRVLKAFEAHPQVKELHVVGGVSANATLRSSLIASLPGIQVRTPVHISYCTDNAAMIAAAAEFSR